MADDPSRWSSDPNAPAVLRVLLRVAEHADVGPTADELARLATRLQPQLTAPAKPAVMRTWSAARVAVVGAVVVGAVVVGALWVRSQREPAQAKHAPPAAPIAPVAPVAPIAPIAPVAPVADPTPAPAAPPRALDDVRPAPPKREPTPTSPRPSAPTPQSPPPPAAPIAPVTPPSPPPAPTAQLPTPAPSEVQLLEQARAALRRGDAAHAFVWASEHERVYPDGALVEEREALAIEALAKLGRRDDARARLQKFAVAYPQSNYRARLQRVTAAQEPR